MLVPDLQITTSAKLNAELATRVSNGEFSAPGVDPSLVVTSATVTLGTGELTLTVAERGRREVSPTPSFSRSVRPRFHSIWADEIGPLRARRVNASVSFVAGPGHGLEMAFLNLLSPVVRQAITPVILELLTDGLIENARTQAAKLAFGCLPSFRQRLFSPCGA